MDLVMVPGRWHGATRRDAVRPRALTVINLVRVYKDLLMSAIWSTTRWVLHLLMVFLTFLPPRAGTPRSVPDHPAHRKRRPTRHHLVPNPSGSEQNAQHGTGHPAPL